MKTLPPYAGFIFMHLSSRHRRCGCAKNGAGAGDADIDAALPQL